MTMLTRPNLTIFPKTSPAYNLLPYHHCCCRLLVLEFVPPDYMLHMSDEANVVPLEKRLHPHVICSHITMLLSLASVGRGIICATRNVAICLLLDEANIVPPEQG